MGIGRRLRLIADERDLFSKRRGIVDRRDLRGDRSDKCRHFENSQRLYLRATNRHPVCSRADSMPGDTTPAYHIRKRAVATVTAVRPYCSRRQFVPAAAGMTAVIDERLAGVPNSNPRMFYLFRDGLRWVSVAEAKKFAEVATRPYQLIRLPR